MVCVIIQASPYKWTKQKVSSFAQPTYPKLPVFIMILNHIHWTWFNTIGIFIVTLIKDCTPYSEDACKAAAEADPKINWKSAGDYGTKGCYVYDSDHPSYANNVYYGTGGTDDEKKMRLISSEFIYRPDGHDCRSNSNL